ncbi:NAD(P)/FAD-dependent oxidoreductase [Pseudoalteromonas rubra]|uniref:NAD(P)/FAD-dependent oxidoreductase n=1 Tax=Pseudoalteromonas rubra TaxID=43658 RepID=UPI000F7A9BE0|nr:NAD(P)/FAD-dependent oxidoreductase [Pseudoalteromonas rubra]
MKYRKVDVVIIGAGPAGATASALLNNLGYQVTVIEKQRFPRFSIGESLLPQCMSFLAEAGLLSALDDVADELAFQYKNGAAFYKNGLTSEFDFRKKFSPGPGETYQVKRGDFDHTLIQTAQQAGVEVLFEHQVEDVDVSAQEPLITISDKHQNRETIQCRFVLDASGFARILPRLLELEKPSSFPIRHSYFTHIEDNIRCEQFDRNKILITVHPSSDDIWLWLIPFADGTASIGVVGKAEQFPADLNNREVLQHFVATVPNLQTLLDKAEWPNDVNRIAGYSADVKQLSGSNFALLGNAGEFLDPVFSSGVTIAMCSASLIAPVLDDYLQGKDADFVERFEKPLRQGVDCFKAFVSAWYRGDFQDVIFYQQQDPQVKSMISSILAGYAWDTNNPYVAHSERRLNVLVELCREQ